MMLSPQRETPGPQSLPGPGRLVSTILDGIRALVPDKTGHRARRRHGCYLTV
jgi:hypothetical protein